jgi:ABC-2 type transport system ATP-binding protein
VAALDGASLWIPQGGILGLLGPNGAGKTTLLKILAGLILPDTGWAKVYGVDIVKHPNEVRNILTYVSGEERSHYWRLTGRENLNFFAVLNGVPRRRVYRRVQEVLSIVGLHEAADERVGRYSSGMKQRLGIARALLSDVQIMLLDEPTRSLDPVAARRMWTLIKENLVGEHGKTIVLATNNMEEATTLCDQVAVLYQGKVKACDSVATVAAKLIEDDHFVVTVVDTPHAGIDQICQVAGVQSVTAAALNGHQELLLKVAVEEPAVHIPLVLEHLMASGVKVVEVKRVRASLGDAIAALTEEPR